MRNRRKCERCGTITSIEKWNEFTPYEGQVCDICERWVCIDCDDRRDIPEFKTYDNLCLDCAPEVLRLTRAGLDKDRIYDIIIYGE